MPRLTPIGHVALEARAREQVVQHRAGLHLLAQAHADGAHHDAVVEEHHVHLRLVLVGLRLGQDVRRGARHHHDLDVVRLLEGREDVLRVGLLHGAAVHADVERLGLREGGAGGGDGERGNGRGVRKRGSLVIVHVSLLCGSGHVVPARRSLGSCGRNRVDGESLDRRAAAAVADQFGQHFADAGPIWKPAPAKPKAWNRPAWSRLGPITGLRSGR